MAGSLIRTFPSVVHKKSAERRCCVWLLVRRRVGYQIAKDKAFDAPINAGDTGLLMTQVGTCSR